MEDDLTWIKEIKPIENVRVGDIYKNDTTFVASNGNTTTLKSRISIYKHKPYGTLQTSHFHTWFGVSFSEMTLEDFFTEVIHKDCWQKIASGLGEVIDY
jgi:hypothetical protein